MLQSSVVVHCACLERENSLAQFVRDHAQAALEQTTYTHSSLAHCNKNNGVTTTVFIVNYRGLLGTALFLEFTPEMIGSHRMRIQKCHQN